MLTLTRLPNWPTLLSRFIESRVDMPFAWGPNDCCSFSIYAIESFTGTLVFPISWDSEETAYAAIEAAGGIEEKCTEMFGPPSLNPRTIRRGDIALCLRDNMQSIAICTGPHVCVPTIERLGFYPNRIVTMHWKIG